MKTWFFVLIVSSLLIFAHGIGPFELDKNKDAIAYEASSSTYFIHGGGVTSFGPTGSSSISFIDHSAGGQAIIGLASSSISFISQKGILYNYGTTSLTLTLDGGATIAFGTLANGTRVTNTTRLKVTQTGAGSVNITAGRQRANSTPATLASNAAPAILSNQIDDDIDGIDVFNGISNCSTVGSHPAIWPSQSGVSTGLGFSNWAASTGKDTTCWGTGTTVADSLNQYAVLQASSSASSFINIASSPPATLYASVGYSLEVKSTQKATVYSGGVVFTATSLP